MNSNLYNISFRFCYLQHRRLQRARVKIAGYKTKSMELFMAVLVCFELMPIPHCRIYVVQYFYINFFKQTNIVQTDLCGTNIEITE
jgi:hypothetical protein